MIPGLTLDDRGDWIRTSDHQTPSLVRYQTALRPDWSGKRRGVACATALLGVPEAPAR